MTQIIFNKNESQILNICNLYVLKLKKCTYVIQESYIKIKIYINWRIKINKQGIKNNWVDIICLQGGLQQETKASHNNRPK